MSIYDSRGIETGKRRHRKCLDCDARWETMETFVRMIGATHRAQAKGTFSG